MNTKLLAAFLASAILLAACGGNEEAAPLGEDVEVVESKDAEEIVQGNCISCHGGNLEGRGTYPALDDIGSRLTEEEILYVIQNGQGVMPKNIIEGAEAEVVAEWLSNKR
ncbi:cytochrome c551 [Paenisporosarcina sp. TG20]|uniref:cytochrome c551 n=1 Tax=Paenisporosarcina sp. TG20 TaxID=1211706 RepID=UPI0003185DBB|nr:cytochrome c [Paenisporosarcina sp. TG20]